MALSKKERKEMRKHRNEWISKSYILRKTQAEELFDFLDSHIDEHGCDCTLRFTVQWLNENLPPEKISDVLEEINRMSGYCDCEVLANCYEGYFDE